MEQQAEVECAREGRLAWVTFNRPEVRNAMTWGMYDGLERLCAELEKDDSVDVVVLRGKGGEAFVAGTDIKQFTQFDDAADAIDYERRIDRVIERLETLQKPTIALLEGFCIGGGAAIAMACDFRYATPELKFGIPIARTLGNCVSMNNIARIVGLVGAARAKEVLMLARLLKAEECYNAGLVTQIFAAQVIEEEVRAVADKLSSFAPLTLKACKEGIRRVQANQRPAPGMDDDLISLCYTSQDFRNAVDAFIHKKTHTWLGK